MHRGGLGGSDRGAVSRRTASHSRRQPDVFAVGGRRPVMEAIRAGQARRVLLARGSHRTEGLRGVMDAAAEAGLRPEQVDRDAIDRLGVRDPQGADALVAPPPELDDRTLAAVSLGPEAALVL